MRSDILQFVNERHVAERATEQAYSFMERIQDQIDADIQGWSQIGGQPYDKLDFASSRELLVRESRKAMYRTAHARGIIRTLVKFIIGAGIVVDFREKDEEKSNFIISWWKKVAKHIKWYSFLEECVTRTFRDGEAFIWKIKPNSLRQLPTFRFIEPDHVAGTKFSDGIETDPNDVQTVTNYHIIFPNGSSSTIQADQVIHIKIEVDRNTKRGRPILESCFPYLTKYGKWIDARMVLNVIRTSVALVREVQGSAMDMSRLRSAQQAQRRSNLETDKAKMLRPGTILSASPGSKWSMLSPNLDARDAAEDGRTILLAIASAIGFPDVFITSDYARTNFASTVIAQNPALREFEARQNWLAESFGEMIDFILESGVENGAIPAKTTIDDITGEETIDFDLSYDIKFPPLLRRDLAQDTAAYKTMNDAYVMSRRTWGLNVGLDPDTEQRIIKEEMTTLPQPEPSKVIDTPVADPTINHRKAIAPKDASMRGVRQKVAA